MWRAQGGIGGHLVEVADGAGDASDEESPDEDPILKRLYAMLTSQHGDGCSRSEEVRGYRADVLVRNDTGTTALLLDRGYDEMSPGRHLRVQYERRRLLADPAEQHVTLRVPGWQVFRGDSPEDEGGDSRLLGR